MTLCNSAEQVELQSANMDRVEENKAFQATIDEQRATQKLLTKVQDRLNEFYAKKGAFLQGKVTASARAHRKKNKLLLFEEAGTQSSIILVANVLAVSLSLPLPPVYGVKECIVHAIQYQKHHIHAV